MNKYDYIFNNIYKRIDNNEIFVKNHAVIKISLDEYINLINSTNLSNESLNNAISDFIDNNYMSDNHDKIKKIKNMISDIFLKDTIHNENNLSAYLIRELDKTTYITPGNLIKILKIYVNLFKEIKIFLSKNK